MPAKSLTFLTFHRDKSGNVSIETHLYHNPLMFLALDTSKFGISGIDFNETQDENISAKSSTFPTFHFDISGKDIKLPHA